MKKILLVLIGVSVIALADMSRNALGVVTDSETNLQWQDDYNDNGGNMKVATWRDAIAYCNELPLDEGGWRVPNKNELLSIVDYRKSNPAIDSRFQNTVSDRYWSSTTHASNTSYAWRVDDNGYSYGGNKAGNNYVRCARSGQ